MCHLYVYVGSPLDTSHTTILLIGASRSRVMADEPIDESDSPAAAAGKSSLFNY